MIAWVRFAFSHFRFLARFESLLQFEQRNLTNVEILLENWNVWNLTILVFVFSQSFVVRFTPRLFFGSIIDSKCETVGAMSHRLCKLSALRWFTNTVSATLGDAMFTSHTSRQLPKKLPLEHRWQRQLVSKRIRHRPRIAASRSARIHASQQFEHWEAKTFTLISWTSTQCGYCLQRRQDNNVSLASLSPTPKPPLFHCEYDECFYYFKTEGRIWNFQNWRGKDFLTDFSLMIIHLSKQQARGGHSRAVTVNSGPWEWKCLSCRRGVGGAILSSSGPWYSAPPPRHDAPGHLVMVVPYFCVFSPRFIFFFFPSALTLLVFFFLFSLRFLLNTNVALNSTALFMTRSCSSFSRSGRVAESHRVSIQRIKASLNQTLKDFLLGGGREGKQEEKRRQQRRETNPQWTSAGTEGSDEEKKGNFSAQSGG